MKPRVCRTKGIEQDYCIGFHEGPDVKNVHLAKSVAFGNGEERGDGIDTD
jgi:hypothetical protein